MRSVLALAYVLILSLNSVSIVVKERPSRKAQYIVHYVLIIVRLI